MYGQWRAERIELENPRPKAFLRLKKFAGILLLTTTASVSVFLAVGFGAWLGYQSAMPREIILPTFTPLLTATPFQPLSSATITPVLPTATPTVTATAYREPVSQLIDGLWTYGQDQPLTEEELAGLVKFFNSDPLPMEEDAYYITFLASETAYGAFAQDYGESLQSYLLRHVAWMDRQIRVADPPVEGGLVARRLIIFADGIWNTDLEVSGYDYLAHGLEDSDGSWSFIEVYCPDRCGFYNQELGLDFGLMHEWIHRVFKLPDHYALDFHPQFDIAGVLAEIPESWRFYAAAGRPDLSNDDFAMGGGGRILRHYSALQLAERRTRGFTHDQERAWSEMNFLAQVPAEVVWDLGPDLAGARVTVYRSQPCPSWYFNSDASACKILGRVPVLEGQLDESDRIAVGNLFAGYENIVPMKEGVLFIKVQTGEEIRFRWLDIRDFNMAIWEGFGESVATAAGGVPLEAVMMRFNLASADDNPENFAWEVEYESLVP
jgi:hypothetical protein